MRINSNIIIDLLQNYKNDDEICELIYSCLGSFADYHRAVYEQELYQKIGGIVSDGEAYRERLMSLDKKRTNNHDAMISQIGMLNRLASQAGLAPVYEGVVSKERPYRREIADAVFSYIEEVINTRS